MFGFGWTGLDPQGPNTEHQSEGVGVHIAIELRIGALRRLSF